MMPLHLLMSPCPAASWRRGSAVAGQLLARYGPDCISYRHYLRGSSIIFTSIKRGCLILRRSKWRRACREVIGAILVRPSTVFKGTRTRHQQYSTAIWHGLVSIRASFICLLLISLFPPSGSVGAYESQKLAPRYSNRCHFLRRPKVSAFVYVHCLQTRLVSDLSIAHRDVSHDASPRKCPRIARGHPPNSLPVSS